MGLHAVHPQTRTKPEGIGMFMLASQFAKQHFTDDSRPSIRTVQRWIEKGDLPGRRIGGRYYVDTLTFAAKGDELVMKVLRDGATTP